MGDRIVLAVTTASIVDAHDPEKACPALDAGWEPVFGKDHAPKSLAGGF
jgi:hypothetical protein